VKIEDIPFYFCDRNSHINEEKVEVITFTENSNTYMGLHVNTILAVEDPTPTLVRSYYDVVD
jgi:hypothetical protein